MIIPFELTPLKDELVYSLLARYHATMQLSNSLAFCKLALGRRDTGHSVLLPTGLGALADRFPSQSTTVETLISQHTAFPYFQTFLVPKRSSLLKEALVSGWSNTSPRATALTDVTGHPFLNFCRVCSSETMRRSGGTSWNRIHQLPGVFYCPIHNEPLTSSDIKAVGNRGLFICPARQDLSRSLKDRLPRALALKLASFSQYFTHNPSDIASKLQLRLGLSKAMRSAGWLHGSGHVRANITRDFTKYIGDDHLEFLGCNVPKISSWIHDMIGRQVVGHHPLQYLLLFAFLGVSIADLEGFPAGEDAVADIIGSGGQIRPRATLQPPSSELLAHFRKSILAEVKTGNTRAQIQKRNARRFRVMLRFDAKWFNKHVARAQPIKRDLEDTSLEDASLLLVIQSAIDRLKHGTINHHAGLQFTQLHRRQTSLHLSGVGGVYHDQ